MLKPNILYWIKLNVISNKVKRLLVFIFINHIIWSDTSKQLTVYLYDT